MQVEYSLQLHAFNQFKAQLRVALPVAKLLAHERQMPISSSLYGERDILRIGRVKVCVAVVFLFKVNNLVFEQLFYAHIRLLIVLAKVISYNVWPFFVV